MVFSIKDNLKRKTSTVNLKHTFFSSLWLVFERLIIFYIRTDAVQFAYEVQIGYDTD